MIDLPVIKPALLLPMQVGAKLLLDCSQAIPNMPVDVQTLGADWIVATGHKLCGPTGIGFLWGRCCFPQARCMQTLSALGSGCTWLKNRVKYIHYIL